MATALSIPISRVESGPIRQLITELELFESKHMLTIHVEPQLNTDGSEVNYFLSVAANHLRGPVLSSNFTALESLLDSLRSIGIPKDDVRLAGNTLKSGLQFSFPNVNLVDADFAKLGLQIPEREKTERKHKFINHFESIG